MALAFRGSASNTVINGGTPTINLTTIAGLAPGDIVVAHCRTAAGTAATPAGWTELIRSSSSGPRVWCYKIMGLTPDTSVAFWAAGGVDDAGAALAMAFSGVHLTTPQDVNETQTAATNPAAITPASNDCAIVVLTSVLANDATPGTIASYTAAPVANASDVNPATVVGAYRLLSGGAGVSEDPAGWSSLTNTSPQSMTIALRPRVVETAVVDAGAITLAGKTVTVSDVELVAVAKASVTLTGKTVTVGNTELVTVANATVTITGKTVTVADIIREVVPVTAAAVLFEGRAVALVDTTPSSSVIAVDKADVELIGKTVTPIDIIAVGKATVAFTGKTVTAADTSTIPVAAAAVAFAGKTVTARDAEIVTVAHTIVALTGKPVTVRDFNIILVNKASVTFAGKTVSVVTSTFEDIPKYIIRGRGSRHELWTQSYGGTIKGRGSRAFLVMR